jgi:hypothetical protein
MGQVKAGAAESSLRAANKARRQRRWAEFFVLLQQAASAGSAEAQEQLGMWYMDGFKEPGGRRLLRRSLVEATNWLAPASKQGRPAAMVDLGWCYDTGRGVKKDPHKALLLYLRAARLKDSAGCLNAAVSYRALGKLAPARYWFGRAAALGDEEGELGLLEMTIRGSSPPGAKAKAVARLQRLSRARDQYIAGAAQDLLAFSDRTSDEKAQRFERMKRNRRIQGDALVGDEWNAIRTVRERVKGDRGLALDESRVPKDLRDLLPYASVLATGEDGLQSELWKLLTPDAWMRFRSAMEARPDRIERIREVVEGAPYSVEMAQLSYLADTYLAFARFRERSRR